MTYMTKSEVMQEYGVCERTVTRWVKNRQIPFLKIGRTIRFPREKIDSLVKVPNVQS